MENDILKQELETTKLDEEKKEFSKHAIIDAEGNKFKAIKEFVIKYQVDNETASKYINEAYFEINNPEEKENKENSVENDSVEAIVVRNNNKIIPAIQEVRKTYGYDLAEAKQRVEKAIEENKKIEKLNNPKSIKKTMIVASASGKKATSAIGRGIVGGALLGPIGLLAGTTAKTKDSTTFLVIYNNGKQETITVKNGGWMFNEYCKYLDK